MILSEQTKKALAYIQHIEVPTDLNPWESGRAFYEKFIPLAGDKEAVFLVEEHTLLTNNQSIPVRIYRPDDHNDLPVIIYFHGGWFNAGNLETHDTPLRQLAKLSQSVIVSVAYRLAPEHPFPEGLDDCEFTVQWLIENASSLHVRPDQIIIAGDSAGGALAATITRKFRHKVAAQLLIYPVTDNTLSSASWTQFQNGPLLDLKGGIQAWEWYLQKEDDTCNPDAIPLLADDLEGLPPTFVAIAEYDPLKDEAVQYAEKLKASGVYVKLKLYRGTTHGFFQMGGVIDDAKSLMKDIVDFIES
ncbi:alpha/beta hydrolase [Sphingobacterium tabacisoli]|uniref:Alpha/beta hydrolase n=1 Tax=Sphingobacterium tabacisoli TaxID=2044855 RepID=A0ABW5L911_9SPHI|nr:alpha/beta hydrolase [Sphingobacterium tabacisoli]